MEYKIQSQREIIETLSQKTGIYSYRFIYFEDLESARKYYHPVSDLIVEDEKGDLHKYMHENMRFDNPHRNIQAKRFIGKRNRSIEDFGVEVKFIKKTKICEGGGWYSNGGIYEVNGMYFEM